MSYTTRCPACGTTFKVVPDQLKISDGWVRCGYCSDVFDASLYLQPWEEPRKEVSPPSTIGGAVASSAASKPQTPAAEGSQPAKPRIPESQVAPSSVVAAIRQQQAMRPAGPLNVPQAAVSPEASARTHSSEQKPHSAAQFLSTPDAPAKPDLVQRAHPLPLPSVSVKDPSSNTANKEAQRLAEQEADLKPDPADDWGDSDFMAELKRYAEEVRAEDEEDAQREAAIEAKNAAEKANEPPARAKPAELPPLPPVPSAFRPRPQRMLRDPRNERHAADDMYSAVPVDDKTTEGEGASAPTQKWGAALGQADAKAPETANLSSNAASAFLSPVVPASPLPSVSKTDLKPKQEKLLPSEKVGGSESANRLVESKKDQRPTSAGLVTPSADQSNSKPATSRFESLRDSDFDDVDSDMPVSAFDDDDEDDDERAGFTVSRLPPARSQSSARSKTKSGTKSDQLEDEVPLAEDDVSSKLMDEGVELSFVQQAKRKAFWESRAVRLSMAALALLLSLVLFGQWAIQERDTLAASKPAFKPMLSSACAILGCELGAVRRIDDVVIERANLQRRLDNLYSFDFEIRNTSDIALAAPAVELSLTGSQGTGQVIARRVFLPQEWPGQPEVVPAGKSLNVSLSLTLSGDQDLASAGFRAFVFYP